MSIITRALRSVLFVRTLAPLVAMAVWATAPLYSQPLYPRPQYPTLGPCENVAVGDLDGDGLLDFVCDAGWFSGNVNVYQGNTDGSFDRVGTLSAGSTPQALAIADTNGDLIQDVIVGDLFGSALSVFIGDGTGSFAPAVTLAVAGGPWELRAADMDLDGDVDVVISIASPAGVQVLSNDGSGSFTVQALVPTVGESRGLEVADFNGDSVPDVVAVQPFNDGFSVLLGDGTGALAAAQFVSSPSARDVAVGDFDADGSLDVALTTDALRLHLGDGAGSFAPGIDVSLIASLPNSVATGDVNGDGVLDLAVTHDTSGLSVLVGNGTGAFALTTLETSGLTRGVVLADFDSDGLDDLAFAGWEAEAVAVVLADAVSGFEPTATSYAAGSRPDMTLCADFTGDGAPDIVLSDLWDDTFTLYVNDGSGHFTPTLPVDSGPATTGMASGDIDQDGDVDLVSVDFNTGYGVYLGDGSGGLSPLPAVTLPSNAGRDIVMDDLDQDGLLDIVISEFQTQLLRIRLGDGTGSFTASSTLTLGFGPRAIDSGDFDNDGIVDLVIASGNSSQVLIGLGNGDGTFVAQPFLSCPGALGAYDVVAGDFNGDGTSDVVVSYAFNQSCLFPGLGGGAFGPAQSFGVGVAARRLAVGDLNDDGTDDLVASNEDAWNFSVFLGDPLSVFATHTAYQAADEPGDVDLADLDGNGSLDVTVPCRTATVLSVHLNRLGVLSTPSFIRGDANSDGLFDVADAVYGLGYLFSGGAAPSCLDAADANRDSNIDLGDAIYTLASLFTAGSPPPPAPHPDCGIDPLGPVLGCATPTCP
ncbi:MAG: VCBS repeat-containing protein [Planctomycetes bacterium]|nr:VCBS repeat-containing protein [Planctomycetota bacterium]